MTNKQKAMLKAFQSALHDAETGKDQKAVVIFDSVIEEEGDAHSYGITFIVNEERYAIIIHKDKIQLIHKGSAIFT